jgi:hypothetical protein
MCYPSLPAEAHYILPEKFQSMLGPPKTTDDASFYDIALLSALEVLVWTLTDLFVLPQEKFQLLLPSAPDAHTLNQSGFTLSHIRAMYPSIDVRNLTNYVHLKAEEARENAVKIRRRKLASAQPIHFAYDEMRSLAISLSQIIRRRLDERRVVTLLRDEIAQTHPDGLSAQEILEIGSAWGLPEHSVSALFDFLIDNAYLVTHVKTVPDGDGVKRTMRIFEPDGEVVSQRVQKYSLLWGLPSC